MKRLYAEAREKGKTKKQSAIYAGYSEKVASPSATRLEKDPDVIAYRERLSGGTFENKGKPKEPEKVEEPKPNEPDEKLEKAAERIAAQCQNQENDNRVAWFSDPAKFLENVMNNHVEDPRLRVDAAKTLMPYRHAKKSEVGKKQSREEEAKEKAKVSKFKPRVVE